jgi:hypothetical protein
MLVLLDGVLAIFHSFDIVLAHIGHFMHLFDTVGIGL